MILVGISGAINHGKSSFAEFLRAAAPMAAHYESSDIIMEVANALRASGPSPNIEDQTAVVIWLQALPQILLDCLNVTINFTSLEITSDRLQTAPEEFSTLIAYLRLMQLQPELANQPINAANKADYRVLLQWLGGYLAKHVSGQLWFREIIRRGQASGSQLIIAGGLRFPDDAACFHGNNGLVITINRPLAIEPDANDVTERERQNIVADCVIQNDGSLAALKAVASRVYHDLINDSLQPTYQASSFEPPTRTGLSFS